MLYPKQQVFPNQYIYSITSKNGFIIAGSDNGLILGAKDGQSWSTLQTDAKSTILPLSAKNSFFFGITDAGEILKSVDGMNWDIKHWIFGIWILVFDFCDL